MMPYQKQTIDNLTPEEIQTRNNILIDSVRIAGFRGIQNLEINLSRITILIGQNNSGKTSILKALQLALGNYSQYISEEDFFINKADQRVKEITIDVRLRPFDTNEKRIEKVFDEKWIHEFGDQIQRDGENEFVAIRTQIKPDEVKGGFECSRYTMQKWPEFDSWQNNDNVKDKDKTNRRMMSISFISVEPQRDIYSELKDKRSSAGKILSNVHYDETDKKKIEKDIKQINQDSVDKSEDLKNFAQYLEKLHQTFQGQGQVKISPFPIKIRDLSKYFSIHFGEDESSLFSMEYHGMGTRSWASILTTKALIESSIDKHHKESKPFFPIFATEEPEAHLHPNAQKTLYRQVSEFNGQVIISTHSPYFVAVANFEDIRLLSKTHSGISVKYVLQELTDQEIKKLHRRIISTRGEMLFAKTWILCEGITEEQLIPAMFELSHNRKRSLFDMGICCMGINGIYYKLFLKLAYYLNIPTYIVSDNDHPKRSQTSTKQKVIRQLSELKEEIGIDPKNYNYFDISYLTDGNDFEKELVEQCNLKEEIIKSLILLETKSLDNIEDKQAKQKALSQYSQEDKDIIKKMRNNKAAYSGFLADIIRDNPHQKEPSKIVPQAVQDCFNKIQEWLK